MITKLLYTSILPVLALILSSCNLTVVTGSGHVVSETRPASDFNRVELDGSGNVVLTQGSEEGLKVEAEDNLMRYLRAEVRGHTLYLGFRDNFDGEIFVPTRPIRYYVNLKSLEGLKISGSGNITAHELQAGQLALDVTGSGDIVVDSLTAQTVESSISGSGKVQLGQGTAPEQRVDIGGSGNYQGEKLAGQAVTVHISGSGNATVRAEETLEARITGSGDIRYYGTPRVTETVTGSGHLSGVSTR